MCILKRRGASRDGWGEAAALWIRCVGLTLNSMSVWFSPQPQCPCCSEEDRLSNPYLPEWTSSESRAQSGESRSPNGAVYHRVHALCSTQLFRLHCDVCLILCVFWVRFPCQPTDSHLLWILLDSFHVSVFMCEMIFRPLAPWKLRDLCTQHTF